MATLATLLLASVACGHAGPRAKKAENAQRRLLLLESESARFFGSSRLKADRNRTASLASAHAAIEKEMVALESLRMRYLDVVRDAKSDRRRIVAMLKIAEIHFDLGARIRRAPYPEDATQNERIAFDQLLSRKAVPLEAVGRGMLAQIRDLAQRRQLSGRFIARARLYETLHASPVPTRRLKPVLVRVLEREWRASGPFAAPRRLLEAGRIGQRAARR